MFKESVTEYVKHNRIRWQKHALERMMERNIFRTDVKQILLDGEIIEEYPDDRPYPSGLFLGFINSEPLHVVVAIDSTSHWCYIITAYKPDSKHFKEDFKTRRK